MITTAFILAIMTFAGAALIFLKLPKLIRRLLIKHSLFTDLAATGAAYIGLSGISSSLIAAIACAAVGLFVSGSLHLQKQKLDREEAQEKIQREYEQVQKAQEPKEEMVKSSILMNIGRKILRAPRILRT